MLFGGDGNDTIDVSGDGARDAARCGSGEDTVVVDRSDTGPSVPKFGRASEGEHVVVKNPTNPPE